jgi:hypothetical protein|tara:strand:+ start:299 stop:763 length:465 start_codon:yes stop_codon:yes gene_type:complete
MKKQRKPLRIRLVQYCLWGIVGFLAVGLMLPFLKGFSPAMQRATETHARSTAYNLKNALSAFFTEYQKFLVPDDQSSDTQLQTDHALMDALLGADLEGERGELNPRRIAFYSSRQAKSMGNGRYRNGLTIYDKGQGELWDPRGKPLPGRARSRR